MIKFNLTAETYDKINACELEYLTNCVSIIEPYQTLYAAYGCEINFGLFWRDKHSKRHITRPPFGKDYECWFGYEITENGCYLCIDTVEGYTLGDSEGFLFIKKKNESLKSILEVTYINEFNSLKKSLEDNLYILEKHKTEIQE